MSTKTIAVDSRVYERLAGEKRQGESFSKAIDRLLDEIGGAHAGGEILERLGRLAALSKPDADRMLEVVAENRSSEEWKALDLR